MTKPSCGSLKRPGLPYMIDACMFLDEVSSDFAEAVDLSARAGVHCIELRGGIWGKAVQEATDDDVARMQQVMAQYGARVTCIGSPVGKCDLYNEDEYQQHLQWFDRMCELAHIFNTKIIRGFPGWNPESSADDRYNEVVPRPDLEPLLPLIAERLAPIVRRAEQEDVYFCLETEMATCSGTCQEVARIIEVCGGSEHLAVAWDINNASSRGEHPLEQGYPLIKERIRHLHVKPNRYMNIETVGDWPDVSYEDVLNILLADGYEGSASIEHWGSPWLMLEGARQLVELLGEIQDRHN